MAVTDLAHGAIGNGSVLALVGPDTGIDWLCLPRFDSPSVFARLLDEARGGTFRFDAGPGATMAMAYLANTNVVRTVIETGEGGCELLDFAPRIPAGLGVNAPTELYRLVRPLHGKPRLRVVFDPRPDYARSPVSLAAIAEGLEVRGGPQPLFLHSNLAATTIAEGRPFRVDRPTSSP